VVQSSIQGFEFDDNENLFSDLSNPYLKIVNYLEGFPFIPICGQFRAIRVFVNLFAFDITSNTFLEMQQILAWYGRDIGGNARNKLSRQYNGGHYQGAERWDPVGYNFKNGSKLTIPP
jgi:hypothetical protein